MNPQYVYFIIFACIAYLVVSDPSIAKFIVYVTGIAKFQFEKIKWWILHNPRNPIVKFMIWRRSYQLAKQLQKEFNERRMD